jgi:UDP-GlcNAc:undecaprenyl-phosphate GlcNAc-1-phosphate transferase
VSTLLQTLVKGHAISLSLLLAAVVSYLLTPLVLRLALRIGAVDQAGVTARKAHAEDIPRLGGLAIVGAFLVPMLALRALDSSAGTIFFEDGRLAFGLLGGGGAIALLGLYDDLAGASPKLKLLVQVSVACGAMALGFRIEHIDLPFVLGRQLDLLVFPITLLWIVGITNAVNLIDGLDGLAAGVAALGIAPLAIIAVDAGNVPLALVSVSLAGSLLGFLAHNFHPARIFMGDTGSMFVGFVLALVTIQSSHKSTAVVSLLVPVLVLGVPILDTLLTVFRRAWLGNPLFGADRGHIHHRLMDRGLSHRNTVLALYAVAAGFAAVGTALHFNRSRDFVGWILLGSVVMTAGILRAVGYLRVGNVRRGIADASALRQRNRAARKRLTDISAMLPPGAPLDEVVRAASAMAGAVGADWAELSLTDGLAAGGGPWTWGEEPPSDGAVPGRFELPLRGPRGEVIGRIHLEWTATPPPDPSLVPTLEQAFRALGAALWGARAQPSAGAARAATAGAEGR